MDFAAGMAATILILTPVLLILEWRHWRQRQKLVSEINEMMNRHREWINAALSREENP